MTDFQVLEDSCRWPGRFYILFYFDINVCWCNLYVFAHVYLIYTYTSIYFVLLKCKFWFRKLYFICLNLPDFYSPPQRGITPSTWHQISAGPKFQALTCKRMCECMCECMHASIKPQTISYVSDMQITSSIVNVK